MFPSPVTVFGGIGFVGRYVVRELVAAGAAVRVAVRHPERGAFLKSMGEVGQVSLVRADILNEASVVSAVDGARAIINTIGILVEGRHQRFDDIHVKGAGMIAAASQSNGIEHIVHISAIGADIEAPAKYSRSKGAGENAVKLYVPGAVILRPSVVFGAEDKFFNRLAFLARVLPIMPLIEGETKLQPIYVVDLAKAVVASLTKAGATGETFELGGPRVYRFREVMELVFDQLGRKRMLLPVPRGLAASVAAILEWLPNPPLTRDQLRLLRNDNVVGENVKTLSDLGVEATPPAVVLPTYLGRFRKDNV